MSKLGIYETIIATKIVEAVVKDERPEEGGFDLSAGMFGQAMSDFVREIARELNRNNVATNRGQDWEVFSVKVLDHIENYTVPQYGDKGEDLVTEYSAEDCINQAKKYMARFGKNSRPGQEKLDLVKAAHYIQLAFDKMDE